MHNTDKTVGKIVSRQMEWYCYDRLPAEIKKVLMYFPFDLSSEETYNQLTGGLPYKMWKMHLIFFMKEMRNEGEAEGLTYDEQAQRPRLLRSRVREMRSARAWRKLCMGMAKRGSQMPKARKSDARKDSSVSHTCKGKESTNTVGDVPKRYKVEWEGG